MVNEEHYARLKESVQAWNNWRDHNLNIIPDLSDANLSGLDLNRADLQGTDLNGADLSYAHLNGANLIGANLIGANLRGANLREANLIDADLMGADLMGTDLNGADLKGVYLIRANLCGTDLRKTDLRNTRLNGADLSGANLRGLDLRRVDLNGANLTRANLTEAELCGANLNGANLTGAELIGANLSRTQALGTDFTGAKFTGACLEEWHYNSATKLNDIVCQYVYLKNNKRERCPISGDFAPGEFTKRFKKALETVDLIFRNGVDWEAFAYSFRKIQLENETSELTIRSIEVIDDIVLIKVNISEQADKTNFHNDFFKGYEFAKKELEPQYQARLGDKDKEINRLFLLINQANDKLGEVPKLMAEQPKVQQNFLASVYGVAGNVEGEFMSEFNQPKYDQRNSNNQFVDTAQTGSNPTFNQYNSSEQKKTLAEAASEIEKLLKQLEETNPTATETEKVAYVNDETTPSFKRRVVGAFQAGGETAIDEFILENKYLKVAKAAIKGWLQPGS